MALATAIPADEHSHAGLRSGSAVQPQRSLASALSWGAIAAGAVAAASLSLILLILGVGLGLSSVSPWASGDLSAATFGVSTILWLTLTQILASAMGGYLAGRLRTKWTEVHGDEVYFRDTAHGFLAWAVASLATAALLTSVIGSILGDGVQVGATMVGGVAGPASAAVGGAAASTRIAQGSDGGSMGYFVDSLFRRDAAAAALAPGTAGSPAGMDAKEWASGKDAAEVSRIFMNGSRSEPLPSEDMRYVAQIVAQHTGLSQQDAEKRVADVHAKSYAKVRDAEVATRDLVAQAA